MSELIDIKVPINKTYFSTFLNNFVSIYYFNDNSITVESLKNLLFPPEHSDVDFNELVNFIKIIFDDLIIINKDSQRLKDDLQIKYNFEEEVYANILSVATSKRREIIHQINSKFSQEKNTYKTMNWGIKSVLSANKEDYFPERYTDIEFSYSKGGSNSNSSTSTNTNPDAHKLEHKNITFTKNDINRVFNEMKKIKESLKKINSIK